MYSKVVIVTVSLLTITSLAIADSDGFNIESTKELMKAMPRSKVVNGKQFVLGTFQKSNWFRAAHICRFNGMDLASINSANEQDIISKLIDGSRIDGPYWISGNDLGSRNNWYWLAYGNPISYFNWNAGEPNNYLNRNERCLSLTPKATQYRWNDVPCDNYYLYHFVCQILTQTIDK